MKRLLQWPLGLPLGAAVLALVALMWLVSLVSGYDVVADVDVGALNAAPGADHWLGTDKLGRDVLWRLITASESFFGPGLLAATTALALGVPGGAAAGWLGGYSAGAIRYLFSVVDALPRFILVLLACAIYGNSVWLIALVAGLAYAPTLGEAVYTRIQGFRRAEFVLAAEAHGVHPARTLGFHLLWVNCRHLIGRHAVQLFAYFLLLETTLSFLGGLENAASFGVSQPQPSWGNMIAFEWREVGANAWSSWAPGVALWSVILAAGLVGEGLAERDA
jgi:ABC-type dipeptide/oligopeptide/nickel transport system permease subunit